MSADLTSAPPAWRQTLGSSGAWLLLAGCLLLLGAVLVAGERTTSYDDLRAAVTSGDVEEVEIRGGLAELADGFALTEVHWRKGPVARVTEVVEATSLSAVDESGPDAPVVRGRVDERLTDLDATLRVARGGDLNGYAELGSWRVPSWAGLLGITVAICTLMLLVLGPQPWRATRWAWFWLLGSVPLVGALAFLLLGGSTSVLRPTRPERRLTGGWALLLAVVIHAAAGSVLAAVL